MSHILCLVIIQLRKEEFKNGSADITVSHLSDRSLVALQGEAFSVAEACKHYYIMSGKFLVVLALLDLVLFTMYSI